MVADAVTSVLAILALFAGKYFGWTFLDALLGIVGAVLVAKWSWGLIRESGKTLIDAEMDEPIVLDIKQAIELYPSALKLTDLHVWKVAQDKFACILVVEYTKQRVHADDLRAYLAGFSRVVHLSIEINPPAQFTMVSRGSSKVMLQR